MPRLVLSLWTHAILLPRITSCWDCKLLQVPDPIPNSARGLRLLNPNLGKLRLWLSPVLGKAVPSVSVDFLMMLSAYREFFTCFFLGGVNILQFLERESGVQGRPEPYRTGTKVFHSSAHCIRVLCGYGNLILLPSGCLSWGTPFSLLPSARKCRGLGAACRRLPAAGLVQGRTCSPAPPL